MNEGSDWIGAPCRDGGDWMCGVHVLSLVVVGLGFDAHSLSLPSSGGF